MTFLINGTSICAICKKKDIAFMMRRLHVEGQHFGTICMKCFDACKAKAKEEIENERRKETASGSAHVVHGTEG